MQERDRGRDTADMSRSRSRFCRRWLKLGETRDDFLAGNGEGVFNVDGERLRTGLTDDALGVCGTLPIHLQVMDGNIFTGAKAERNRVAGKEKLGIIRVDLDALKIGKLHCRISRSGKTVSAGRKDKTGLLARQRSDGGANSGGRILLTPRVSAEFDYRCTVRGGIGAQS